MGVSLLPRIRYAVLPQLGPAFSSAVLYRFDVNISEASVLGLVGAGGIGAPLIFAMNQYAWNDVSAIFLGFVLLVWLIDVGAARLRTRRTAAANWWFALRPAFFQIFSVFVMRVLIMGLSSCYD